jgi:hypothetical protein
MGPRTEDVVILLKVCASTGNETLRFPREQSGRGVKLNTHPQLVPRSSEYGSIHPLPHMPS